MSIFPFRQNKVVKFWTSYKGKGKYRDFREDRYYLLFLIDKVKKILFFFPITSNRNNPDEYPSQYKVSNPRPPCLESEIYPESFVNVNILIRVPLEAIPYLNLCNECSSFCLESDFEKITKLHSNLPSYGTEIDEVNMSIEYFKK
jgi:hypothetical protein